MNKSGDSSKIQIYQNKSGLKEKLNYYFVRNLILSILKLLGSLASDFKNIGCLNISSNEIGAPFKLFTHILTIFSALPQVLYLLKEYKKLLTYPNSSIKDFYQTHCSLILEKKKVYLKGDFQVVFY